ncbi:hypothetical protein [Halobacillus mangrovi]|uniref:Uncharacterized protein n=1 Tax=Halobacillus mangrovi TaxID=402384 RepID=A0A1W5ZWS1_9BACI|nr:hypothetical protein [Halobacillus mangrovi]ARI77691.1 hypothetical protein HM131_12910 [Halobacillus mangrovi]
MAVAELNSYEILLHQPLKTNQIMKMYKCISKHGCDIYLHQDHLIADGGHLPKLLSFFLFVDLREPILMIVDGDNVGAAFEEIHNCWEENIISTTCRRKYSGSMVNSSTSILV